MGAEIEVLDAVVEGETVHVRPPAGPLARIRGLAANPRLQGAAAATAGMLAGAATVGLLRRLGAEPSPVGAEPSPASPARPVGVPIPVPVPMLSGTYVVRVRVGPPPLGPSPFGPGADLPR